jgi:DinB family protein
VSAPHPRLHSGRPGADEYSAHASADIGRVEGDDAILALTAQKRATVLLFESLDEERVRGLRYAPGKWTLKEVLGHLADDERIFAYRALCVARGDEQALSSFDEKLYVEGAGFEARPLSGLVREYRAVRQATITLLEGLAPEAWQRRGRVAGYTASVRGLAFHIAGHELRHLAAVREKYLAR